MPYFEDKKIKSHKQHLNNLEKWKSKRETGEKLAAENHYHHHHQEALMTKMTMMTNHELKHNERS